MPRTTDAAKPELPPEDEDTALDRAAAAGNVTDTEKVLLNDLAATQELVLRQEEMIKALSAKVDALSPDEPVEEPERPTLPELPEGHKRYASRYSEHVLVKVAGRRIYIDGQPIFEPHQHIEFQGGVYQTGDPDIQAFIEGHAEFGVTVWEDPTAIARHSTVEVSTGPKSTTSPRVAQPLVAPMQ